MFRGFKRGAGPKGSRVVWKGCGKRFGGLTGLWPEGCGLPCRAMNEYICRLSAALKTEQPGCARWKCTTFSAAHHLFPPGGGTLLSTYLPARHVILSRRRRILVHADSTSSLINTSRKAESRQPIADSGFLTPSARGRTCSFCSLRGRRQGAQLLP